jgi:hypothetical protein
MADTREIRARATTGDVEAMFALGKLLLEEVISAIGPQRSEAQCGPAIEEGLEWLNRAGRSGHVGAILEAAHIYHLLDRTEEEEKTLRHAARTSDPEAIQALNSFLRIQRRRQEMSDDSSNLVHQHTENDVARGPYPAWQQLTEQAGAAPSWPTVIASVTISTAVIPFVQTLISKAAEDTYEGVRKLLRQYATRHASNKQVVDNPLIVIEDTSLRLDIRTDAADEALRALPNLKKLAEEKKRNKRPKLTWKKRKNKRTKLTWNEETKTWESSPANR